MNDDMDSAQQAAAFWGLAENTAIPIEDRLQCALQALEFYGGEFIKREEE